MMVINMEKKKLPITEEEVAENMKKLKEAIGIAKLDNQAKLDSDYLKDLELMAKGIITPDELVEKVKKKHCHN